MPITEIITPDRASQMNQGNQSGARLAANDPTRLRFETVMNVPDPPKVHKSISGRIMSALGHMAPLGLFFGPPGWIGSAAASGLGAVGASKMAKERSQQVQAPASMPISYPGLGAGGGMAMMGMSEDSGLDVVAQSRMDALSAASRQVKY